MADRIVAKYTGPTQHTRILTKADQRELGAEKDSIKGDLVWDLEHGHTLDVTDADDAVLRYLANDNSFQVKRVSGRDEDDTIVTSEAAPQGEE